MSFSLSGLPAFEYFQPTTIREALDLMREFPSACIYAGGTDLFPRLRKQIISGDVLIDLKWINDFPETMIQANGDLVINPLTTFSHLQAYLEMIPAGEVLSDAIHQLGTRSLRNRATLAGNLCNASPAADASASLLVYDAIVKLQSVQGERDVPVCEFFVGPGKSVIQTGELLTGITIPVQEPHSRGTYLKISRNKVADLAICGVAVLGYPDAQHGCGFNFRIAVSGANAIPVVVPGVWDILSTTMNQACLMKAAREVANSVTPLSDVRSTREYRKEMVYELTLQALTQTLQKFGVEVAQ